MTELSYFWGGTATGDAVLAPYDDDEFSDYMQAVVGSIDRTLQGVIFGILNELEVTNPSGLTIQVDTGKALVDGKLYVNDDAVNLTLDAAPGSGNDYYTIVLQKDFTTQTVRAALVGPVNGGPAPAVTQTDGTIWEITLATVIQTSGGTISVTDARYPVTPHPVFSYRQGGNATFWGFIGTTNYVPIGQVKMFGGLVRWTGSAAAVGSVVVTLPETLPHGCVAFAMQTTSNTALIVYKVGASTTSITIYWRDMDGTTHTTVEFQWLAVGS